MTWLRWFRRDNRNDDTPLRAWREAWNAAADAPARQELDALRRTFAVMALNADEHEIEHEMLDGLVSLVGLAETIARGGPAPIPTGHRAVGSEPCYFVAPVTLPDDPSQPGGTLLLTGTRAIFLGGGRSLTIPWHSVRQCQRQDRDVLLVRGDRPDAHRVRCNTYGEALGAVFLARHFSAGRRV